MCLLKRQGKALPPSLQVRVQGQAMVVTLGDAAAELGGLYGLTHLTMWVWKACWETLS